MTVLNNNIYMNLGELNEVGLINADGTLKKVVTNLPNADAMTIDPLDGHLIVSAFGSAIYDVDPVAGTASVLLNVAADGLAFDPVSGILYAAIYPASGPGNEVKGFDIKSKAVVFDSGTITGGPDGIALGAGTLAGNVFVNTNSGTLVEVNLKTAAQTLIASGGSRGDFVTADPNNGTLLVSQSDRLLRLTGPAGGGFVPTSSGLVTTTTTLDATLNPTASGATATLTAAVTTAASVVPTGSITFTIDGVAQPPVAVAIVGGRVLATITTATLAPGTHTFSAAYSGDATFAPSTSGSVQRIVPQSNFSGADGPTVTLVQRSAARVRPTELVLNFDESLAPGPAQELADYHLVKVTKKSTRPIGIKSAVYDPAARTVTLTLARWINLHRGLRLTIDGTGPNAVASVSGVLLDGQGNGRPGSDYVAVVSNANRIFQAAGRGARKK
jgi:Bacterial Ig-like domain (group 3)/Putative flagellar system-associated repeat